MAIFRSRFWRRKLWKFRNLAMALSLFTWNNQLYKYTKRTWTTKHINRITLNTISNYYITKVYCTLSFYRCTCNTLQKPHECGFDCEWVGDSPGATYFSSDYRYDTLAKPLHLPHLRKQSSICASTYSKTKPRTFTFVMLPDSRDMTSTITVASNITLHLNFITVDVKKYMN